MQACDWSDFLESSSLETDSVVFDCFDQFYAMIDFGFYDYWCWFWTSFSRYEACLASIAASYWFCDATIRSCLCFSMSSFQKQIVWEHSILYQLYRYPLLVCAKFLPSRTLDNFGSPKRQDLSLHLSRHFCFLCYWVFSWATFLTLFTWPWLHLLLW